MKSAGYREYKADKIGRNYLYEYHLNNEDTKYQNYYTRDSNLILLPLYEENFLLEAIDKIVKKRWRIIDNTTRYGWLAACYYKRTVSPEDAKMLSALGKKIGPENCTEAIERIEILAEKLHPREVPTAAIAVLTETDTALMLRNRFRQRRGAKASLKLVKDRFPTIFTISDAFAVKRTNVGC